MILEVKDLSISYNSHIAIENINFCIDNGEYVCFVGENGSRKKYINKSYYGT